MESSILTQKWRADLAFGGERSKETPTSLTKFAEGLEKAECCHQTFSGRDGKRTLFREVCWSEELPEAQGSFAKHLRSIICQGSLGEMAGALCARVVMLLLEQTVAPNGNPEAGPEGPLGRDGCHHSRAWSSAPSCSVFCLSAGSGEQQPGTAHRWERVSNPAVA